MTENEKNLKHRLILKIITPTFFGIITSRDFEAQGKHVFL